MIEQLRTFKDKRGDLTLFEVGKDFPFPIVRAFWIHNVPEGEERGKHANKTSYQYLIAVKGTVRLCLEDAEGRRMYELNSPDKGLLIPPLTWNELLYFSEDAVLLVLSSHPYCPENYINSHDEFLKLIGK